MRAIAVPPSKQLLIVIVIVKLARRSVLLKNLNDLKWVIVEEIEKLGYTAEIFTNPRGNARPRLCSVLAPA
jgi:hypothetical protein